MAISQIFKGNKSGSQDYTLSDIANKIGVSSTELPIITNYAKTIGGLAKSRSLDPEAFANEIKIVNAEFKSFFSKLDPTSINKQVAAVARKVGKLDSLLNHDSLSTKNVKVIYKVVKSVIVSLIKIIKDITIGDYANLSKDATNFFIEMKIILKMFVEGLTNIKKCIAQKINNVDGLKIKIFKANNEFKNDIKKLKEIVKKDVESARLEFKKDSTKISEWFNKIFNELDNKISVIRTNKSDIPKHKYPDKTFTLEIKPERKANNLDAKKKYVKFEDLKYKSQQEKVPEIDIKTVKQKVINDNDIVSRSIEDSCKRLSQEISKELDLDPPSMRGVKTPLVSPKLNEQIPLIEFDNISLSSSMD